MFNKIFKSCFLKENNFYAYFTTLIYALFVFLWHETNNALPTSDAITYLEHSYSQYYVFKEDGIIQGIINLYSSRGWRPQIYPIFITPVLIVTNGDALLTITIISTFFSGFLTYILYKLLNMELSNSYASVLTLFILVTPTIYNTYLSFFSEIIYLPLALSFFYFLLKSENFSNARYTKFSAIFLALTLCVRPAEAILFMLAIIPFIFFSYKKNIVTAESILSSVNIFIITILLIFYITYVLPHNKPYLYLTIIICLSLLYFLLKFFRTDLYKSNNFIQFSAITCFIGFIYWIPAIDKLLIWTVEASSGSVAKSLAWHFRSSSFITLYNEFIRSYGHIILPLLLTFPIIFFKKNLRSIRSEKMIIIFLSSFLLIIFLFLSYSYFLNDGQITRRLLLPFFLLSILLSWLFFNKNIKYSKFSLLLIFCLTSYSFIYIYSQSIKDEYINKYTTLTYNASKNKITKLIKNKTVSDYFNYKNKFWHLVSDSRKDKHIQLSNILVKNSCKYDPRECLAGKKIFFSMPLLYNNENLDPFTMGFVNNSLYKNNFWIGYILIKKNMNPMITLKNNNVEYILVEVNNMYTDNIINERGKIGSAENFTSEILKNHNNKNLKNIIMIDDIYINNTKLLLFKLI